MSEAPAEFGLIARHFAPLAGPGALGLSDDAALLAPPPGRALVLAADAMVAGVHFRASDPPDRVGRKLLRVNLSDLAAMAATPLGYLMTVSAPRDTTEAWFAGFAAGLAADQAEFGLELLGGDTTRTPGPLCLSLTILGHVAPGAALRRAGARAGDELWVTGTIGDGALGLAALEGRVPDPDGFLAGRYQLPVPRLGLDLSAARAGIDVSDGLLQDCGHLARAAGLGAEIRLDRVPLSDAARAAGPDWLEACVTGGDDYELLLAVPPGAWSEPPSGARLTRIGRFVPGQGVKALEPDGQERSIARHGWSHF